VNKPRASGVDSSIGLSARLPFGFAELEAADFAEDEALDTDDAPELDEGAAEVVELAEAEPEDDTDAEAEPVGTEADAEPEPEARSDTAAEPDADAADAAAESDGSPTFPTTDVGAESALTVYVAPPNTVVVPLCARVKAEPPIEVTTVSTPLPVANGAISEAEPL